ncbi:E3 SUMO-protein ligase PIAS2-like [Myzus persicae]|uniref:E3 SUMO-protein ligase PIAS2-like n=1 Tax=Myzus persicae TaxID=13164 RepID=UPI000B933B1F|nr:E3 SUMO-protein ligase PIAS2-like [Myzus persicae]
MSNIHDETCRNMLAQFRVNDLKLLLRAFGQSIEGRRTELRRRAMELISSKPADLNYIAYLSKIFDIYHSMNQLQNRQQRTYQLQRYPQQSVQVPRARLPQFPSKVEGLARGCPTDANIFPRNTVANNHIQYASGYQPVRPQTVVRPQLPTNQQNTSNLVLNPPSSGNSNASTTIPSPQIVANYKFTKLPFYEVIKDVIKPTLLDDTSRCILSKFPEGMREHEFKYTMSIEDLDYIALNRDISYGKSNYLFNCQIRICQLDQIVSTKVTDELPKGLIIKINSTACPLPPFLPARPGKESRLTSGPINCAQILQLNPISPNRITIYWIPDGKKYALAMYIVKQISADTLIKELRVNKVRSSEETKSDIIKRLTVVDPDLASTSFNFSLVCQLSTVKMKLPAKSIHCNHLQCFDAATFILMNEKNPKWICPTCHESCLYDEIRIEGYFLEIVEELALRDDIKEISLLDNGSWFIPEKCKDTKNKNSTIDDTVIEIDDFEESTESIEEPRPGCSKWQKHGKLEQSIFDLSIDEDE